MALEVEAGVAGGQRGGGHDGDLLTALDLVAAVVVGLDEHRVGDVLDLGVVVRRAFVDGADAVGSVGVAQRSGGGGVTGVAGASRGECGAVCCATEVGCGAAFEVRRIVAARAATSMNVAARAA